MMNPIKLLALLLFTLTTLVSCEPEEQIIPASISFAEGTNQTPTIPMDGSETIFTFSSTQEWTATVDADKPWCTVSPANGVAGTAMTITMTVAENTTYDERVATITIASKDIEQKIDIIQSQNDSFVLQVLQQNTLLTQVANLLPQH